MMKDAQKCEEWRSRTGASAPKRRIFSNASSHTVKLLVALSVELSAGVNRGLNEGLDLQEGVLKPRESRA